MCAPCTVAAIAQVRPDDVLLGEAEHSKTSSSHGRVKDDTRVRHQYRPFVQLHPAWHQQNRLEDVTQPLTGDFTDAQQRWRILARLDTWTPDQGQQALTFSKALWE